MTVVEFQHVKPGKGGAFVRTKLKNVRTGAVLDRTFRADEKVAARGHRQAGDAVPLPRGRRLRVHGQRDLRPAARRRPSELGDAVELPQGRRHRRPADVRGRGRRRRPARRGRARRSPRPSRACRATGCRARASRRRSRPGSSCRCRCSSSPARRVKVDTRTGRVPRARLSAAGAMAVAGSRREARERALGLVLRAARCATSSVDELLERAPGRARRVRACSSCAASRSTATRSTRCSASTPSTGRSSACRWSTARCCGSARYELGWSPTCPTAVVISEAVELAKQYSTKDSGRFVNGLLVAHRRAGAARRPSRATGEVDAVTETIAVADRRSRSCSARSDVGTDRPWIVIVWNDPVNLMTYVVYVFQKLFGYSREKATKLMLQVHHEGKCRRVRRHAREVRGRRRPPARARPVGDDGTPVRA